MQELIYPFMISIYRFSNIQKELDIALQKLSTFLPDAESLIESLIYNVFAVLEKEKNDILEHAYRTYYNVGTQFRSIDEKTKDGNINA